MRKSFKLFCTTLLLAGSFQVNLFAQSGPPGPPPGPGPCGDPFGGPACPIDGGVSILIAAGLAYGGKKTYDMSRNKS